MPHPESRFDIPAVPDAVIFDMDGTLTDTEGTWDVVRRGLAAAAGVAWKDEYTLAMIGMSTIEWSTYLARLLATSADEAARLTIDAMIDHYRRGVTLLPGAIEAVRRMASIAPVGIASSSPARLIEAGVEALGIADVVQVRVSTEQVAAGKPAPDGYLLACSLLDAEPIRSIAVEDSHHGLLSALNAGMRVIAVPNPEFPPTTEVLTRADAVLGSLNELTKDLVSSLFTSR